MTTADHRESDGQSHSQKTGYFRAGGDGGLITAGFATLAKAAADDDDCRRQQDAVTPSALSCDRRGFRTCQNHRQFEATGAPTSGVHGSNLTVSLENSIEFIADGHAHALPNSIIGLPQL